MLEQFSHEQAPVNHRGYFSRLGWAINFVLILAFTGQLLVQQVVTKYWPQLLTEYWFIWLVAVAMTYGIAFPMGGVLLRTVPTPPKPAGTPLTVREFLQHYIALLAGLYLANFATLAIIAVMGEQWGAVFYNPTATALDQPVWSNLLLACVFAPIAEELLFRKALLSRLRPYGDGFAIVASALAFALVHGNLHQFFYSLVAGILLGYVAVRTGSIRQTILLHALANFVGAGILPLFLLLGDGALNMLGFLVMFVIGMGTFSGFLLARNAKLEPSTYPLELVEKWQYLLVNPGFTFLCISAIASALFYLAY